MIHAILWIRQLKKKAGVCPKYLDTLSKDHVPWPRTVSIQYASTFHTHVKSSLPKEHKNIKTPMATNDVSV